MSHHCHWPGCEKEVAPKLWGCLMHWKMLPTGLQNKIWRAYVPGQEITKTPSAEYVAAAKEVQDWCIEHDKGIKEMKDGKFPGAKDKG